MTEPAVELRIDILASERGRRVRFAGKAELETAGPIWSLTERLTREAEEGASSPVVLDLTDAVRVDGAAAAILVELQCRLQSRDVSCSFAGASEAARQLLELYAGDSPPCLRAAPVGEHLLEQVGRVTAYLLHELKLVLAFFGQGLRSIAAGFRRPRSINWRDLPLLAERAGADGLPIVVLINFLVGAIMAFQGAIQLKQFGANIFVADLVALSLTRELGPLMTAIIVCGRSGAAFAAELGTMEVNEEVDALRTIGLDPMRHLVFPRALGLLLVLPLLTVIADAVGIAGGLLVGITGLDLTVIRYANQTQGALSVWDVSSGVLKSFVFALAIAGIACQQGLSASGGAQGVGRRTTAAVVATLFALILIDAAFTVTFYVFGL